MLGFSLISAGALVWPVSDSWQAHFQVTFGLFQAETFFHRESDELFPWYKQVK